MKINPINLQSYKKNITGQTIFSNTFYTTTLSFGNDSFKPLVQLLFQTEV